MTASHHGEDAHVRTLQAVLRRVGAEPVAARVRDGNGAARQASLQRGSRATAKRPARSARCAPASTSASLLLARHAGWTLADYWRPEHPTQLAVRDVVGAHLRRQAGRADRRRPTTAASRPTPSPGLDRPRFRAAGRSRSGRGRDAQAAGPDADEDPRRDGGRARDGRWQRTLDRHEADARPPGPARVQGRGRGLARHRPACPARAAPARRRPASQSRSRTATAGIAREQVP